MVGIYCRVSTKGQEKDGYSLDTQEDSGRAFAASLGEGCEVYREALSGKRLENREEWQHLADDIKAGTTDKVWVIDGDRLSRNQLDSLIMLKFLQEQEIGFYVNGKKIDFDNPDDVMVFQITQAVAERTGADIVRKSKRGIRRSIDNGTWAVNRLYGYERQFEPDGSVKWVVVPQQAEAIRRMFDLYLEGMSLNKVTKSLNKEGYRSWGGGYFEVSRISRTLKQPKYTGYAYNIKGELIESKVYEPIISKEIWKKASELVKMNPSRSFRKKADHISTGILRCGKCGEAFHFHTRGHNGQRRGYYEHHQDGVKECDQLPVSIRDYFLDLLLSTLYLMTIQDQESVKKLYEEEQRKLEQEKGQIGHHIVRIEKRETELNVEKKRLIQSIRKGVIGDSDVADDMREIHSELRTLAKDREEYMKSIRESQERYEILMAKFGADNLVKFADGTNLLKREMLRVLVEKATITERQVAIKMATGQTFSLSYPRAGRHKDHNARGDDQDYIYQYIEKIQDEFSSTKAFEETFSKTLELLEPRTDSQV